MYLCRRIILSIPALIIISSVVFFLSKVMPGSVASSFMEQDDLLSIPTSLESREEIFRQYLERTGQDIPLFYFNIASLAEPDTLYRIFPENHQEFLQRPFF